jgi:hypothetical protein
MYLALHAKFLLATGALHMDHDGELLWTWIKICEVF